MSKEKKAVPTDVKKVVLYLEDIKAQAESSERNLQNLQGQLARTQSAIQQEIGILNHARHLLNTYQLPSKPKEEPVAAKELEVK